MSKEAGAEEMAQVLQLVDGAEGKGNGQS